MKRDRRYLRHLKKGTKFKTIFGICYEVDEKRRGFMTVRKVGADVSTTIVQLSTRTERVEVISDEEYARALFSI